MGEHPSVRWQNIIQSKLVFNRRAPPKNLHVPFTPKSEPLSSMSSYVSTPSSVRNNNSSRKNLLSTPRNSNYSEKTRSESKIENMLVKKQGNAPSKENGGNANTEAKKVEEIVGTKGPRLSIRIPGKTRKYRLQSKKRSRSKRV